MMGVLNGKRLWFCEYCLGLFYFFFLDSDYGEENSDGSIFEGLLYIG